MWRVPPIAGAVIVVHQKFRAGPSHVQTVVDSSSVSMRRICLTSDPVETGRRTTSASYPKMAVHATLNFLATHGERLILSQEPHCLRRVKLSHRPFDHVRRQAFFPAREF